MRLQTLTIDNFKGIAHLQIDFDGQDADIYGDNATGKTTVYDAFLWLLFGKDSTGRQDFEVKPLAPDGTVRDHGVDVSVTATLETNETIYTLSRTLREKWAKRRGSAAKELTGHETQFAVDGLPVSKADYQARVDALIPEAQFRVLTDPYYFAGRMAWRERRSLLFDAFGGLTDDDVAAATPELAPLLAAKGNHTVDEFRAVLADDHRRTAAELNRLPVRIDEAARSIVPGIDPDAAEAALADLAHERKELAARLDTSAAAETAELAAQIRAIGAEHAALERQNQSYRDDQIAEARQVKYEETHRIRAQLDKLPAPQVLEADLRRTREDIGQLTMAVEAARAEWHRVNGQSVMVDTVCPTCGQTMPSDRVAAAVKALEAAKGHDLEHITAKGKRLAQELETAKEHLQSIETMMQESQKDRRHLEHELQDVEEIVAAFRPDDMPGYAQQARALAQKKAALEQAMERIDEQGRIDQTPIELSLAEIDRQVDVQRATLATHAANEQQRARVDELQAKLKELQRHQDDVERLQVLCDQFVAAKADMVQSAINDRFGLVAFRLFDRQINGALVDTCKVMVDGVPYDDLNHAAQINAGLDIINTMANHYNVWAPIFVDNAESVTQLLHTDAQTIRLIVSAADKTLRVEKKEDNHGIDRVA